MEFHCIRLSSKFFIRTFKVYLNSTNISLVKLIFIELGFYCGWNGRWFLILCLVTVAKGFFSCFVGRFCIRRHCGTLIHLNKIAFLVLEVYDWSWHIQVTMLSSFVSNPFTFFFQSFFKEIAWNTEIMLKSNIDSGHPCFFLYLKRNVTEEFWFITMFAWGHFCVELTCF